MLTSLKATERLRKYVDGYEWTVEDTYAAQNMCPYETVAYGFSRFCSLFTYEEWVGFEYSVDVAFQYNDGFQSPFGVSQFFPAPFIVASANMYSALSASVTSRR
jgi:hypothetical protein